MKSDHGALQVWQLHPEEHFLGIHSKEIFKKPLVTITQFLIN